MDIVERLTTTSRADDDVYEVMGDARLEIEHLRTKLKTMERTWLSPETYQTLMEERQETLKELAKYKSATKWYKYLMKYL